MRKSNRFPIIHIIGLPGAGKTTLAERLSKKLNLPVYRIGEFRAQFPQSAVGEADAWVALFKRLSKKQWCNCILETTGLNRRESFLRDAFPFFRIMTIKLEAPKKVLYERIEKKKKGEQGGDWLFSASYKNKREFVAKLYKVFKKIPAEVRINTNKFAKYEVLKIALKELQLFTI